MNEVFTVQRQTNLFPALTTQQQKQLRDFSDLLDKVQPLKSRHRSDLPAAVNQLSAWLTADRRDLPRDYMSQPRWQSAYLRYFMPWNIFRQVRLLQSLRITLEDGAVIADLGAGPMTTLFALWIARPDLRPRQLTYIGIDRAESALKIGRKLFLEMAGQAGRNWRIQTVKSVVSDRLRVSADLLVAANFLNEVQTGDSAGKVVAQWRRLLKPAGRILLIEPGIRPAAKRLFTIRQQCLATGLMPEAPCTHRDECPLPASRTSAWCHFNFETDGAPDWLVKLSRIAKLPKARTSLSFLLVADNENPQSNTKPPLLARIVSEPFDLPGTTLGQYACSQRGLLLIKRQPHERRIEQGELVPVKWPNAPQRDKKSRAIMVELEE